MRRTHSLVLSAAFPIEKRSPDQRERGGHCALSYGFTALGELVAQGLRLNHARVHGYVDGARRLLLLRVRPSHPCDAHANIGAQTLASDSRHGLGRLRADGAVLFNGAASSFLQKLRAKKPRSSAWGSISIRTAPSISVGRKRTARAPSPTARE